MDELRNEIKHEIRHHKTRPDRVYEFMLRFMDLKDYQNLKMSLLNRLLEIGLRLTDNSMVWIKKSMIM